ncbi:MAG: glycine cleavage T C-terminal barrel domain-containing protein, partial [Mariniblastus sp.]
GLKFVADSTPAVGMEFKEDEKVIGRVTSVANSPTQGSIGLGYIRRKFASPGTELIGATVTE